MTTGITMRGRSFAPLALFGVLAALSASVQGQVVVKDHVTDSSLWSGTARISNWEGTGVSPDFYAACAFTGNGGALKTVEGIFWNVDSANDANGIIWANVDFQIIFYENTTAFVNDPVNGTSKFVFDTPDNVDWMTPVATFFDSGFGETFDLHRFTIDVEGLGLTTTPGQVQLVALTPIGNSILDGETGMMFSNGGVGSVGSEPDWWARVSLTPLGPDSLPNLSAPHDHVAYRVELGVAPCPADIIENSTVDVEDLLSLLAAWGPCPAPCAPDIIENEVVDVEDLLALLAAWGPCD